MRIVLCYPVEKKHIDRMAAIVPEAEIVDAGQERIAEELPTADIFCGHAKVPVPWSEVVAGGRLQWIQSSAAGMDHCLTPEVIASDITVSSASGVLADQVADQTMALLFGIQRSIPTFVDAQKRREFIRLPTRDVTGATIAIVGFGANGRRLAEVLCPFKTRLLATDYFPRDKPDYVEQLLPPEQLDGVLAQSDIAILTAPLNEFTRGMFDAPLLAKMKPGAVLVNVARGLLVVEEDMVAALESGQLAGAAVDVTEIEPLPEESKLWDAPGALITPHVGGQRASRIDDMTNLFCLNLQRYLDGQQAINLVDKRLGFPTPEDSLRKFLETHKQPSPKGQTPARDN